MTDGLAAQDKDPQVAAFETIVSNIGLIRAELETLEGDDRTDLVKLTEGRVGRMLATFKPAPQPRASRNGKGPKA